jgi:hypothetical protein
LKSVGSSGGAVKAEAEGLAEFVETRAPPPLVG